jgi:inosine triphosphate pyrophosphatase
MSVDRIIFISSNATKIAEITAKLASIEREFQLPVIGAFTDATICELPEIQGSPREVARSKCAAAYDALLEHGNFCQVLDTVFPDTAPHANSVGTWIMVEDTSLEFHGLNGMPGVYIKDFLAKLGLRKLSALGRAQLGTSPTSAPAAARARTLLALRQFPDTRQIGPLIVEGVTDGHIVPLPDDFTGPSYGFDPIFYVDSVKATYHDMKLEVKNGVSHRAKAIEALVNRLPIMNSILNLTHADIFSDDFWDSSDSHAK